MSLTLALLLFSSRICSHETNIVLTDPLNSITCNLPAFRFFQNTTLVLNELIPTDPNYSTCSWHDDKITAVEMCGAMDNPYQCTLYTDNTCGNGNSEHTNETATDTIIPDIGNAYKTVFSDPSDQWLKVSWDGEDQLQTIRSFHCIPRTSSADGAFTIGSVTSGGKGNTSTEGLDAVSATGTDKPSQGSSRIRVRLLGALAGAGFVLMLLYI